MIERIVLFIVGIPLAAAGLGLSAAFGIFAFIGMPCSWSASAASAVP